MYKTLSIIKKLLKDMVFLIVTKPMQKNQWFNNMFYKLISIMILLWRNAVLKSN